MKEKLSKFLFDYEELINEITIDNGYKNSRVIIVEMIESENFFSIDLSNSIFTEEKRQYYYEKLAELSKILSAKERREIKGKLLQILKHSPPFTYKGAKHSKKTGASKSVIEIVSIAEETIEKGNQYYTVKLFFGTDRKNTDSEDLNEMFSGDRNNNVISYGTCNVSVPLGDKHKRGEIERPKFWKLQFKEDPEKHITILNINLKNREEFSELISLYSASLTNKDVLIFIHGYNVCFADAARRAAQITFDLSFGGVSIFYSWPSDGQLKGYMGDRDDSEWSIPHLKNFLIEVFNSLSLSEYNKINIIAHSMGTYTASKAIIEAENLYEGKLKFNNIILAAPDIDRDIFINDIAPEFLNKESIRKVTLYASQKDKALWGSEVLRFNKISRAGMAGDNIVLIDGIDSIDASDIDTDFLGHGYFAGEPALLDDILQVVCNEKNPEERGLEKNIKEGKIFWKIYQQEE